MTLRADFPFRFDGSGRTSDVSHAKWVRGLIEQVVFTAPGERVMRPLFGSGVAELVFAPASPEVASTVQVLVHGALQQWLSDLILVEGVEVTAQDATITVIVSYSLLLTGEAQRETFERGTSA